MYVKQNLSKWKDLPSDHGRYQHLRRLSLLYLVSEQFLRIVDVRTS